MAYAHWFARLRDHAAQARILARIRRLLLGNPGDVRPVREGVSEMRIDYGPGYRVYFTRRGHSLIILLAGGDKSTQAKDIQSRRSWRGTCRSMVMPKTKTRRWDVTRHLRNERDMAAYLNAALEDGDPMLVAAALGDIARAKGMTSVARKAGLGRESLYKSLSPEGHPELATVLKVVQALGLKLTAAELR